MLRAHTGLAAMLAPVSQPASPLAKPQTKSPPILDSHFPMRQQCAGESPLIQRSSRSNIKAWPASKLGMLEERNGHRTFPRSAM